MFALLLSNWRLIGIGAAVIAIASLAFVVNGWREDSKSLAVERSAYQQAITGFEEQLRQIQEQEQIAREVASDLLKENARLELGRIANPIGPVRLQINASFTAIQVPTATASDNGAATGNGLQGPFEVDIAPELDALVTIADQQAARLVSCQAFISRHIGL